MHSRKPNPSFFQQKEAPVDASKAISQRCRAARKTGFLNLSSNSLRNLPEFVFGEPILDADEKYWECEPVTKIDLSFNSLTGLPSNISNVGLELLTLIIRSNELVALPNELFECKKLRILDISSNKLGEVSDLFHGLSELRELHFNDNQLRQLPNSLQACSQLSVLNVGNNCLTALPNFICNGNSPQYPSRLKTLHASGNKIASLSSAPQQEVRISLPFLESLELHKNLLSPSSIVFINCPMLGYVNLSENKLTSCPLFITCPKLSRFHVSNNRIRHLQASEGNSFGSNTQQSGNSGNGDLFGPTGCVSSSLVELHVNNNEISTIPDAFIYCLPLKVLDISNNNLNDLNSCLGYVKSLQRIAVEGNPIRTIRRTMLTESTVNLKTYLRTRCADAQEVLRFETIQNMQEDPCVRGSLYSDGATAALTNKQAGNASRLGSEAVGHNGAGSGSNQMGGAINENPQVLQRARDITGNVLDLSNLQLNIFPVSIIPSLYRCDTLANVNSNTNQRSSQGAGAAVSKRYAANVNKQQTHSFNSGVDVANYNSSVIDESKVLCISEVNLSHNNFSQLPNELIQLNNHVSEQGSFGSNRSDQSGIVSLNLSYNQFVPSKQSTGSSTMANRYQSQNRSGNTVQQINKGLEVGTLPAFLEYLDISYNNLTNNELQVIIDSCRNTCTSNNGVISLKFLLAGNNRITSFPTDMCQFLRNIREIQLNCNSLTTLQDVPFHLLNCLEIINLSDNRLVNIGMMWEAKQLRTVMLDNNSLSVIPPELSLLANISSLSLHGNPQKGIRFDVMQRGTDAIVDYLRNRLTNQPMTTQATIGNHSNGGYNSSFANSSMSMNHRQGMDSGLRDRGDVDSFSGQREMKDGARTTTNSVNNNNPNGSVFNSCRR